MANLLTDQSVRLDLGGESQQYLTFTVLGETLGIGILDVKEIIEVGGMTRVPMTLDSVRGVINLRGNVVPVVDLSYRLGNQVATLSKRSCIVMVELFVDGDPQPMGMLVDAVNEILEIPEQNIQNAPEFGTDIRGEFIQRMGLHNDGFIILLNIERVMSVEELSDTSFDSSPHQKAMVPQ